MTTPQQLSVNALATIPDGVLLMTQLTYLDVRLPELSFSLLTPRAQLFDNRLTIIPREIGRLTALEALYVRLLLLLPPPNLTFAVAPKLPRHVTA